MPARPGRSARRQEARPYATLLRLRTSSNLPWLGSSLFPRNASIGLGRCSRADARLRPPRPARARPRVRSAHRLVAASSCERGCSRPVFRLSAPPRMPAPSPGKAGACTPRDLRRPYRCTFTAQPVPRYRLASGQPGRSGRLGFPIFGLVAGPHARGFAAGSQNHRHPEAPRDLRRPDRLSRA
jgi:hypothetical protein